MTLGDWILLGLYGVGALVAAIYAVAMIYGVIVLLCRSVWDRWHDRRRA